MRFSNKKQRLFLCEFGQYFNLKMDSNYQWHIFLLFYINSIQQNNKEMLYKSKSNRSLIKTNDLSLMHLTKLSNFLETQQSITQNITKEIKNQINLSKKNQKIMDKTIAKINNEAEQLVQRYEEEKQKNEKLQFLVKHIEEEIYKAKLDKAVQLKNKIQTDKLEQFTNILKVRQKDLQKVCQKTNTSSYELSKKLDTIRALRSQRTIVSELLDKIERELCNLEHCYKVLVIERTVGDKLCKQRIEEFNKLQISANKELQKVTAIAHLSKPQCEEFKKDSKINHDSRSSFAESPNSTATINQITNQRYTIQSQFGKDRQKCKEKKVKLENDLLKLQREKKVKIILNDLGLSSAKELPNNVEELQLSNGEKLDQVCRLNEQIEKVQKCIAQLSKKKKICKQIAPNKHQYLNKMQQMKKSSEQIKSLRLQTRQFKQICKILYQSIQQSTGEQTFERQFFNEEQQIIFYMGFLERFFENSYLQVRVQGNSNKKNVNAAKRLTSLLNNHQFERNHYSIYEEKDLLDFAKKNLQKIEKTSSKIDK